MHAMPRLEISVDYLTRTLEDLVNTPSPTGSTEWAVGFCQNELEAMGFETVITHRGALVATLPGLRSDRKRAVTAHVDTLGAIVKRIKPSGRLELAALNGVMWPTVESEGVTIQTRSGATVRGSLVLTNGSVHVNKNAASEKRSAETLEVRLDERTSSAEETRLLGIEVGDIVAFDPRFEQAESGFIRSRFLDDKAGVACTLAAVKALADLGMSPEQETTILICNTEETGQGGQDGLPADLVELVVVDMACVGEGQNGDEFHCSVCVKDGAGVYSPALTNRLRAIAEQNGIELRPDIYTYYGSDGSVYMRSNGSAQVALVGPGVDTSHGYERTHLDALRDTGNLLAAYLVQTD